MGEPALTTSDKSTSVRHELLLALSSYSHLKPLQTALEEDQPCVQWLTSSEISDIKTIIVEEGYGAYQVDEESIDRRFYPYLSNVIQPRIQSGHISDGSIPGTFDDRKLRWSNTHGAQMVDRASQSLRLAVGPTWYQQCQEDIHRDPEAALQLMLHGVRTYADPYAFFSRGLGVVVIPLTQQGHAFIGKRKATNDYTNFLCFVSGWASFSAMLSGVDIYRDLERELQEEIHLPLPLSNERTRCVGLAGHPLTGEADLVFVTQTDLNEDHFEHETWPEHETWYAIRNRDEAQQLINHGRINNEDEHFRVMFSSHMGLDYLCNNHWSS